MWQQIYFLQRSFWPYRSPSSCLQSLLHQCPEGKPEKDLSLLLSVPSERLFLMQQTILVFLSFINLVFLLSFTLLEVEFN